MFRLPIAICAALLLICARSADGDDLRQAALEIKQPSSVRMASIAQQPVNSDPSRSAPSSDSSTEGISIDHGAVVIRGLKLSAPYVVSWDQIRVLVNGELIYSATDESSETGKRLAARVERELFSGRWVVVFDGNIIAFGSNEDAMTLLGRLALADSLPEKIQEVMDSTLEGLDDVTTAELCAALPLVESDAAVVQQFDSYREEMEAMDESVEAPSESPLQVHDSTQTMYGLSVAGMLLIALSAGTLLGNPPKVAERWSRIIKSRRTHSVVQRCLLLIAAYSVFDLAATLLALRTGHVEELNPLGVGLVLAPWALAAFKVTATCLGMGLLWRLKDYHGAQVASWWLCLVLTLVTVRWVTVQSLFFV